MQEKIDNSVWSAEILPTKQRFSKGDIEIVNSDRGGISIRTRNFSDPLIYYVRNGFIETIQFRAGRKYQGLWYLSGMRSNYAMMRYCDNIGMSHEFSGIEEVQQLYRLAREAIRGIREKEICFNVCCMAEKAGRTGRKGNLFYLKAALDDLIKHFEFEEKL